MLIFLYGDDSFRSRQKLSEIKTKYLISDKSGSGLSLFDFSEKAKINDVLSVFSMSNLLASKRLVITKNIISAGSSDDQKKMAEYIKEDKNILTDLDLVAVFWEEENPKKNNSLFKLLLSKEAVKKQEFGKLEGMKLETWILRRMKELDDRSSITKTALEKLIVYVGSDTNVLDKEIAKLINYSDGHMIEDKDIELLVKAKIDGNIFSAIDALGAGNKKEAMKLFHDNMEKGEDPFYIFSMIIYQFRNMIKIADLKERGMGSEYEISRITKMHPFVIRKTLAQARTFTFDRLKSIYGKLADFDTKVKTGKMDMKMAIDKFVAEL
jgi:DNA polymerase III subunit delta